MLGLLGRGIDPSQGLCQHTTQTKEVLTLSMPEVGLEPRITEFRRPNTLFVLQLASTEIVPVCLIIKPHVRYKLM
jgi:hypothetical protein